MIQLLVLVVISQQELPRRVEIKTGANWMSFPQYFELRDYTQRTQPYFQLELPSGKRL